MTAEDIHVGDRVQVHLDARNWGSDGWFAGTVVRIEPYSQHRSFYWVELDPDVRAILGGGAGLISVLNPKHIRRVNSIGDKSA